MVAATAASEKWNEGQRGIKIITTSPSRRNTTAKVKRRILRRPSEANES